VLIILIVMYKGIKRWRAGASWKKEPKTPAVVQPEQKSNGNVVEVEVEENQVSWQQPPPPPPPSQK
jgi:hypothetical protein